MATRRGLALILVAGVLGILAVLAAAFVTMAQLERKASLQRLYVTKAHLLARSGLEDAVARLSAGQDAALASTRYGGEDYDGNGAFSLVEPANEVVGPGTLDVETCPARQAMRPSFFRRDTFGTLPDLARVEGRLRGYTGGLQGDLVSGGNLYALKVEDESGKINVNGGVLAAPNDPGRGWNGQLARILNVLGAQPELRIANLGTMILAGRPPGGYRSITDLQQRIGVPVDLSPWLTVSSWVDAKVVHPNGFAGQPGIGSLCELKKARAPLALEEGGRPPVNLNAAHRAVLAALLTDLTGATWHHPAYPVTSTIPPTMAASIADAMVAARPFGSWEAFGVFCDGLVPGTITGAYLGDHGGNVPQGGGNLCGADLLKANFDPNTMSNKELPDQLRWRWIDKTDLSTWSTEGSLGPTGTFRIGVVGRVLDSQGKVLAEATAGATVAAFSLLRQTSQKDFVAGRTYLKDYLSLADASPDPTEGATASPAWWGGPPPGVGLAAMTYPCSPLALPKPSLPGNPAETDGAIGLATVQVPEGPHDPTFVHHFDDSWDADVGQPPGRRDSGINDASLAAMDLSKGVWPSSPGAEPSTFCPDGVHIQEGRSPAFQALGNLPVTLTSNLTGTSDIDNHGALSYWVKPLYYLGRFEFALPQDWEYTYDFSCVRTAGGVTQVLMLGRNQSFWGMCLENYAPPRDPLDQAGLMNCERMSLDCDDDALPLEAHRLPGARWYLATATWDTFDSDNQDIQVRGARTTSVSCPAFSSVYPDPFAASQNQNLTPDAGICMVLGGQEAAGFPDTFGSRTYGNQVIDEFAIYDFGNVGAAAIAQNLDWSSDRFMAGRYCRQDARFLSGVIEPDPGRPARLLRADWTACLPRETRKELWVPAAFGGNNVGIIGGFIPEGGTDRFLDPLLDDRPDPAMRIELELLDEAGTLSGPALRPLARGGAVTTAPLQRFRYRVRFETTLENPASDPVLETPFLDDVTFFWQPVTGPKVLAWEGA